MIKKKDKRNFQTFTIEPYTSYIEKLSKHLNQQNIATPRNIRFERTDINRMFRGQINDLFEITLNDQSNKATVTVHLANKKIKTLTFNNYARLLLWIYRRVETTSAILETASVENKDYYEAIKDQLLQAADIIHTEFDITKI